MKRAQQQCATDVAETVPFEATQVAMQHYSKELEVPEFVEDITQISRSLAKEFSDADGTEESQGPIVFHKSSQVESHVFKTSLYRGPRIPIKNDLLDGYSCYVTPRSRSTICGWC